MRTTRGYFDGPLECGERLVLPERLGHHWTRVLRMQQEDTAVLFNGDGREYRVRLLSLAKRGVEVAVESAAMVDRESPVHVTLAQGLCRGEKMDLVLQKATELGVRRIQLLNTERSEVRLAGDRADRRMEHWRQVLHSASEQSGRTRIPELEPPKPLSEWAASEEPDAMKLVLDPAAGTHLRALAPAQKVVVAIGPEGGFGESETALLQRRGYLSLSLGPRVLRTETAGLAAIAAIQAAWGDLG